MQLPSAAALARWCVRHLGAPPTERLFTHAHLSVVWGVRLADGRRVVVKVRPHEARLAGCHAVQRHLYEAGFPCPEPLLGPTPLADGMATAERLVPGGRLLAAGPRAPGLFAAALARLVATAPAAGTVPSLSPAPPWIGWDHGGPGVWPRPDDLDADLNALPEPAWLAGLARRVRDRLTGGALPEVVGHGDFESHNIRWDGTRLLAVHDWDSAVQRPEAAIAGAASAVFLEAGAGRRVLLADSEAFLAAYEQARGRPWSAREREVAWAAGLWVLAFNAKKETVRRPGGPACAHLAAEARQRLRRAGA
jgi:Ser/Thr protein kinase RdoA (MazF antagonist)